MVYIPPDQINMAVFFWYLFKFDLSSVYATVHLYTGRFTFYKVPESHSHNLSGHPVLKT